MHSSCNCFSYQLRFASRIFIRDYFSFVLIFRSKTLSLTSDFYSELTSTSASRINVLILNTVKSASAYTFWFDISNINRFLELNNSIKCRKKRLEKFYTYTVIKFPSLKPKQWKMAFIISSTDASALPRMCVLMMFKCLANHAAFKSVGNTDSIIVRNVIFAHASMKLCAPSENDQNHKIHEKSQRQSFTWDLWRFFEQKLVQRIDTSKSNGIQFKNFESPFGTAGWRWKTSTEFFTWRTNTLLKNQCLNDKLTQSVCRLVTCFDGIRHCIDYFHAFVMNRR